MILFGEKTLTGLSKPAASKRQKCPWVPCVLSEWWWLSLPDSYQQTGQMYLVKLLDGQLREEKALLELGGKTSQMLLAAGPAGGGLGLQVDVVPLGRQRHIFSGIAHHLFNEDSKNQIKNKPEKLNGETADIVLNASLSPIISGEKTAPLAFRSRHSIGSICSCLLRNKKVQDTAVKDG